MKAGLKYYFLIISIVSLLIFSNQLLTAQIVRNEIPEKLFYAVEMNGTVCGYLEATEKSIEINNKTMLEGKLHLFIMLSALGSEFNTEMNAVSISDPVSRKSSKETIHFTQGTTERSIEVTIKNNIATIKSSLKSQPVEIQLDDDVLCGQDETFFKVKRDFWENGATEKSYKILQAMEEKVQTSVFTKIGNETIELEGKTYETMIIEEYNKETGIKVTYWLSPDCDYFVKFEVLNRRIFLTDHTVVDKIKVADMDENIFVKTNKSISDVPSIIYTKLKVKIQPTGVDLSEEGLNVPGQKFTGTVKENLIDGILEIEYPRYNGNNSPPFPYDYSKDESLKKYLEPENSIQSDDPVLVKKAEEITSGSKDSWDAAKKITKWVAENIGYAIPGGGNARTTYDIRAGECGAHSMLVTAFCRAVGIPSRVVWGAMYVPNRGGGFGQHGWNEIYMGDAGWIPVDATAFETDFVDAGHIRIAELQSASTSFNGQEIEILEYKLLTEETNPEMTDKYSSYLGKYTNIESSRTFEVFEKDGALSVDIPGQMVLPFNDENDEGRWYCKLTTNLYLEFKMEEERNINNMILHEIATMTKKSAPEKLDDGVPEKFLPYLGKYFFAQVNQEFEVIYLDGSLAVKDPSREQPIKLQPPDDNGGWKDEFNKYIVYFELDESGQANLLKFDGANMFLRGELAIPIVEKEIDSSGIEAGIKKYRELEKAVPDVYIFTERSINNLGYKYLNTDKIKEAVEVFKLNVEAYPESFNVYDSLGEAYMKSGEKELAIKNYEKSLELNPENTNAKNMLEKIHGN